MSSKASSSVSPCSRSAVLEWHVHLGIRPEWLRVLILSMAFIPAYVLFSLVLMTLSALTTRILGWRTPEDAELRIRDVEWPLLNWVRYTVSVQLVRIFAGSLYRSTPVWTFYMRLNGAQLGQRVFVNSLGVTDHNLLEFGDDVVIGGDAHVSGHIVEGGIVKTSKVRLGRGVTVGVGSVVTIGTVAGRKLPDWCAELRPQVLTTRRALGVHGHPRPEARDVLKPFYHVEGKGPVFIMVPGLDGTALLFYRQIPRLAPSFRVVSFRLPDDPETTMEDLVDDLSSIIRDVTARDTDPRVFLCGESFGGALSLSFALTHPELVRGLVILNSFSRVRQRLQLRFGLPLLKKVPWGAMQLARRFTEWKLHTSHTRKEDLREFRERIKAIGKDGYIRRLEILQGYDVRTRIQEIDVPTLFLAADEDRLVPAVSEARFMAGNMANASVQILEGFGHICLINHDFDLLDQDRAVDRASGSDGERRRQKNEPS